MQKILVTGGTGVLGREIVKELRQRGADVVTLTHQRGTADRYGDLLTGEGLEAAFRDRDVVVHAATSALRPLEDLQMTQQLVAAAQKTGVKHLAYVSIAGIDGLGYDYYRVKVAGEQLVMRSGVPYTIQRATQFFEFVANLLDMLRVGPVQLVPPHVKLQPAEAAAVGKTFAQLVLQPPQGHRTADLAGPEVLTLETLARHWRGARWVLKVPIPHPGLQAMQTDKLVPLHPQVVGASWADWLVAPATQKNPYRKK